MRVIYKKILPSIANTARSGGVPRGTERNEAIALFGEERVVERGLWRWIEIRRLPRRIHLLLGSVELSCKGWIALNRCK